MEDKVFNGKIKLFQVFRQFDKDGDGYVSYEDFESCLKSIKVHASKNEVASMMKLIDKNNLGYLNFSEFSKVFTPSMSDNLVKIPQNDTYFPNLHPNRANLTQQMNIQSEVQDKITTIRQGFQPDADSRKFLLIFYLFYRTYCPNKIQCQTRFWKHFWKLPAREEYARIYLRANQTWEIHFHELWKE